MNETENAKNWKVKIDFVGRLLEDKDTPTPLKEVLAEWLQDRAKEILPNRNTGK